MSAGTHTPIRLCVGCGQRGPQADLTRFVAHESTLQLDRERRRPGRGAYLHHSPACWDAFVARKSPVRSLRRSVDRPLRIALVDELRRAVAT